MGKLEPQSIEFADSGPFQVNATVVSRAPASAVFAVLKDNRGGARWLGSGVTSVKRTSDPEHGVGATRTVTSFNGMAKLDEQFISGSRCPTLNLSGQRIRAAEQDELDVTATDDSIPGNGLSLDLTRTYSSAAAATDGPFGYGWADSYGMYLTAIDPGVAGVFQENGSVAAFTENAAVQFVPASRVDATLVYDSSSGQWIFTRDADGDVYGFTAAGELISETDPDGYKTALSYNASGNLSTVTDPGGRTFSFAWGACGTSTCVTSVTDPAGRVIHYSYNAAGDLTGVEDVGGAWTYYTYNTSNEMTGDTDAEGNTTTFAYNSAGQVASEVDPDNTTTTWAYGLSGGSGTTAVTDPAGYVTVYGLNQGQVSEEIQGYGTTAQTATTYTYDPVSDGVVTETTAAGTAEAETTSYAYNDAGDVGGSTADMVETVDADGGTATASYNTANEPVAQTNPAGETVTSAYSSTDDDITSTTAPTPAGTNLTTYSYSAAAPGDPTAVDADAGGADAEDTTSSYDSYGDLTTSTDADGNTTTSTYNVLGEKTSMVSPEGNTSGADPAEYTTTYSYDAYGNLVKTVDPNGATTTATYSPDGNELTSTDADGNTTTNTYNGDGELIKTVQPDGSTITYGYNGDGEQTSETDADGNTTTWTYDPLGHQISETQPGGQTTTWTYDLNGNKTSETDPNGNVTTYTYNADNQLLTTTEADGTVESSTYDPDGNQTSYSDGNNDTTTYSYNDLDQLTAQTLPGGQETSYGYDANGNQVTETQPGGQVTTTAYNGDNQPTAVTYSDGTHPVSYSYDPDGNVTTMVDASGTTTYSYNAEDQLTSETDGAGASVGYSYDPAGNVTGIVYPNGKTVTDTYNRMNELASVTDWDGNTTTFAYDPDGNQTVMTYPNGITETAAYNSSDEVTSIADTNATDGTVAAFDYGYDPDGNITSETDTGTPDAGTTTYSYNSLDELTGYNGPAGDTSYGYDKANNLTSGPTGAGQAFNSDDELCWSGGTTTVTCADPPSGATTYSYNADGDRTATTPATGTATGYTWNAANQLTAVTPASGSSTSYTYNGDGLLQSETTGSNATNYVWDTQVSVPELLSDGTNYYIYGNTTGPVEQIDATSGATSYLLTDQLGSTRAITNNAGTVTATYTYNPWGQLVASTGTASNPFLYAGYYYDQASGLYYLQARWYDPLTGQFLSVDPEISSTEAPYNYTENQPTGSIDPTGLDKYGCSESVCIDIHSWHDKGPYVEYAIVLEKGESCLAPREIVELHYGPTDREPPSLYVPNPNDGLCWNGSIFPVNYRDGARLGELNVGWYVCGTITGWPGEPCGRIGKGEVPKDAPLGVLDRRYK